MFIIINLLNLAHIKERERKSEIDQSPWKIFKFLNILGILLKWIRLKLTRWIFK